VRTVPPIHLAGSDDAAAIAVLSRDEIEQGLPWRWTPARVARAIANPAVNVAVVRDAGRLQAFGIMRYADDAAHLLLLAVHPEQRRAGLGSALLRWLELVAVNAGIGVVRLEARDDRPAARAFYRHHGYCERAVIAGMYSGIKDGVCLERSLYVASPPGTPIALPGGPAMDIKDIIRDNQVRFLRFRQGYLYYAVTVPGEPADYMFPVPVADVGDATLQAQEKAILFMRYIRKAMEEGSFVPVTRD
jgi:ribosomal-protein-alanine N-acetyltransferase